MTFAGLISALVFIQTAIPTAASELPYGRASIQKATESNAENPHATESNAAKPSTTKPSVYDDPTEELLIEDLETIEELETDEIITKHYALDPEDYTELPDNETLFAGYMEKLLYGDTDTAPADAIGEIYLKEGIPRYIYDSLKQGFYPIAIGETASTRISIPFEQYEELSWTYEELGVSPEDDPDSLKNAVFKKLGEVFSPREIVACLLHDCPYELYWYDKTRGYSISCILERDGDKATLSELSFCFPVAEAYADGENMVDSQKVDSVKEAANNAASIVSRYQDQNDYEKLTSYAETICRLVSYDDSAAADPDIPYGDPWQLVYVFDKDPDTNVVCEGYSKAFQYLCDLSDFKSDRITCYTMAGNAYLFLWDEEYYMFPHMWNIVTMEDGKNYLVDLTNCDDPDGSLGSDWTRLFLSAPEENTDGLWYFTLEDYPIAYECDPEFQNMYSESGILNLADEDYYQKTLSHLKGFYKDKLSSVSLPKGWAWENGNTVLDELGGPYTFPAHYDGSGSLSGKQDTDLSVTVLPRKLDPDWITIEASPTVYDGTAHCFPVSIYDKDLDYLLTEGTDFTVTYTDNINAGTALFSIRGIGTYDGESVYSFVIQKATPALTIGAGNTITKKTGDTPFTLDASLSNQGTLTYRSSDPQVATVNTAGMVTIQGTGHAVITVSYAGDHNYHEVSVEVSVTVEAGSGNHSRPSGSGGSSGGGNGGTSTSAIRSVPEGYNGPTQIIGNAIVPDYVVTGSWSQGEDGTWSFTKTDGTACVNDWAAVYNPYSNLSNNQMAFGWFRFDENGHMLTGWYTDEQGDRYYLNPLSDNTKGFMITGWSQIDGKWYYFNERSDGTRGRLLTSAVTPDGYIVDADGVWTGQATN